MANYKDFIRIFRMKEKRLWLIMWMLLEVIDL